MVAGTKQHNHTHSIILLEVLENGGECFPHLERDRIAAGRIVEGDPANAIIDMRQHLVSR